MALALSQTPNASPVKHKQMDPHQVIFQTHINKDGKICEGKERFECPYCKTSNAHIAESHTDPRGNQYLTFDCVECSECWQEIY